MSASTVPPGPSREPDEPPSAPSSGVPGLRREVAASSLAFDAATLRGDRALAAGDRVGFAAAIDEQRAILADTERRLSHAVARAFAAREGHRS